MFRGSASDVTKAELLKKLCDVAAPIIDEYISVHLPKEIALRDWLAQPLHDFARKEGLSRKLVNQLDAMGITHVGHLVVKTQEGMLKQKGMGRKLLQELMACLNRAAPKVAESWHVGEWVLSETIHSYDPAEGRAKGTLLYEYTGFFAEKSAGRH